MPCGEHNMQPSGRGVRSTSVFVWLHWIWFPFQTSVLLEDRNKTAGSSGFPKTWRWTMRNCCRLVVSKQQTPQKCMVRSVTWLRHSQVCAYILGAYMVTEPGPLALWSLPTLQPLSHPSCPALSGTGPWRSLLCPCPVSNAPLRPHPSQRFPPPTLGACEMRVVGARRSPLFQWDLVTSNFSYSLGLSSLPHSLEW